MTITVSYIIIIIYTLALCMLLFYSLTQLQLLWAYIKTKQQPLNTDFYDVNNQIELPNVTIQLPIYNEKYVIERLLLCVSELQYPAHKLQIQVLDDSTDDSLAFTDNLVKSLAAKGLNIQHCTRPTRENFKAGALKAALPNATGELIAIFDADFLPKPNWLFQTVIYFKNPQIGVVQTRWGHLNKNYSILTKAQAFILDTHFTLEQTGRNYSNCFINFNGTAGIWRKQCILDAGNWQGDTLTEDLDLSYRAQLKGWKFKYLEDVVTPAELPVIISAARSQQFRWNKGGAQNFIKLFGKVRASAMVSTKAKVHAFFHLLNSTMFFFALLASVLSVPMMFIKNTNSQFSNIYSINSVFFVSTIILFVCNWVVYKKLHGANRFVLFEFMQQFFYFFTIALGFSLHNTLAISEAYMGKKSEFIRTPKFNITAASGNWKGKQYITHRLTITNFLEASLFIYFAAAIVLGIYFTDYTFLLFYAMLCTGFGYIVVNSFKGK